MDRLKKEMRDRKKKEDEYLRTQAVDDAWIECEEATNRLK